MKKRILAVVLCAAMLLSVVPFTLTAGAALATDDTAKTFFTVHTPADPSVKDNNDYICYNNAHSNKAWGIARYTNETDPWVRDSYPVVMDGEAFFPFKLDDDHSHQIFKHEEGKTNSLNSTYSSQFIVKRGITFSPVTYELDTSWGQDEQPISALYSDAADYNYVVMRFKTTGGVEGSSSGLGMEVGGNTVGGATLKDVTLYDVKTGEVTKYTSGKVMQIPYNFDGYIIVNKSSVTGTVANVKRISFYPYIFGYENNWDGKTMNFGNMMIVKDISAFLQVHGAPIFTLDSTDKSVTVSSDDAAAVFSTDKDAADTSWLAKDQFNATLADIGADREVTVYAKYVGSEKTSYNKIWTDPYSTHKGDGAYYLMNVYDDAQYFSHTSYNASQTPAEFAGSGWPSATVCKNARGEHSGDSSFSRLFIKELDGETFIEFDRNPAIVNSCGNNTIKTAGITYKGTKGVHSSVDTTNLNYVAIRLRIVEDTPVNAERSFYIYAGGYKNATQATAGSYQASSWADAYLIDKTTGAVSPAQSYKGNLIFTGDFNGWVVFPVTAFPDGKYLLTQGSTTFQPYIHDNTCHDKLGTGWYDATLCFGDVVLFGDEDLFKSVHVCGAAGHVEETAATCNKKATCSVCGQSYGEVDPDAHGTNTELRGVITADCQQPGYTGDTWCKDCETKIADGTPIQQGTCADKDGKWETDGTYHWHTCTCGAILDKATHSGGIATCTDLAVCEICQIGYGELDEDNHCDKDAEYEFDANEHFYTCECGDTFGNAKHEGGTATCKDQAICKVCKQPYGEKNADNHVGETEVKDIVAAECGKEGFTGNTYCKDCGVKIKDGEKIEATGNHTAAEELKDAAEATTTKPGYTGDKVCKDCGFVMEKGEVIPTLTDDTNNNEGQTPGGSDDEQTPGGDNTGDGDNAGTGEDGDGDNAGAGNENEGSASPDTGDNASILVAVLMALMAGAVLALSKKRAQSK